MYGRQTQASRDPDTWQDVLAGLPPLKELPTFNYTACWGPVVLPQRKIVSEHPFTKYFLKSWNSCDPIALVGVETKEE